MHLDRTFWYLELETGEQLYLLGNRKEKGGEGKESGRKGRWERGGGETLG